MLGGFAVDLVEDELDYRRALDPEEPGKWKVPLLKKKRTSGDSHETRMDTYGVMIPF